jgi:hypothetical protein
VKRFSTPKNILHVYYHSKRAVCSHASCFLTLLLLSRHARPYDSGLGIVGYDVIIPGFGLGIVQLDSEAGLQPEPSVQRVFGRFRFRWSLCVQKSRVGEARKSALLLMIMCADQFLLYVLI